MVIIKTIVQHHNHNTNHPFLALLDSGGSHTMINSWCLMKGVTPTILSHSISFSSMAGKLNASRVVHLQAIKIPEFSKSQTIHNETAFGFDNSNVKFDIILGQTFL